MLLIYVIYKLCLNCRFGCLSSRLFYHQLTDLYRKVIIAQKLPQCTQYINRTQSIAPSKVKRGNPPPSLHGQLLWRDFFYAAATNNPHFDRMLSNPICVQVNWIKNSEGNTAVLV